MLNAHDMDSKSFLILEELSCKAVGGEFFLKVLMAAEARKDDKAN